MKIQIASLTVCRYVLFFASVKSFIAVGVAALVSLLVTASKSLSSANISVHVGFSSARSFAEMMGIFFPSHNSYLHVVDSFQLQMVFSFPFLCANDLRLSLLNIRARSFLLSCTYGVHTQG